MIEGEIYVDDLIYFIEKDLLQHVKLESPDPSNPIVISNIPEGWNLIGKGNYAGVFYHNRFPQYAVKIYAKGRAGIENENRVYKMLGSHESFSLCYYTTNRYLILKRLHATTLYDCLKKGIFIPEKIIKDINEAIKFIRKKGLNPHDIHFKNVGMQDGKGVIIDVSDFLKEDNCYLWHDCEKFYRKVYKRMPFVIPLPDIVLNLGRKLYRFYKKLKRKLVR